MVGLNSKCLVLSSWIYRETLISVIFIRLRIIVLGDEFMTCLLHSVIVDQLRAMI